MSKYWRWFLPGYLFALPMTIIGCVIALLFYRAKSWIWYKGALTCIGGMKDGHTRIWGRPNAQTLGWLVIFDTAENREMPDLRVHEYTHVVQAYIGGIVGLIATPVLFAVLGGPVGWGLILGGFIGGLGFALLYAILFTYFLIKMRTDWYWAYMANPFEKQAYSKQDTYIADTSKHPWGV